MTAPVASLRGVSHRYGATLALDGVDLEIPAGTMAGMIGPDGVGKSTLMGLVAGVIRLQRGALRTLGGDMAEKAHRDRVCPRIAYLPQGLGRNLYMDLSIQENLDFFGRLFGQGARERARRIGTLAQATGLGPFLDRPAGQLSGGMKQKLGLCCALLHDPDLLLLDEPTTGVDPLSRRQFWDLIGAIRAERPDLSLLVSTAYMEEAERFQWLVAMNAGRILAQGSPGQLKAAHGAATLEDAFVALLPADQRGRPGGGAMPPRPSGTRAPVIVAEHLCRRFGAFTAVDDVSFSIEPGEIFGFLGSNGCGKTTTMKMLTGLLPASAGQAWLFGQPVTGDTPATRRRVGYMSQLFSLYGELTVRGNLTLHAHLFQLPPDRIRPRVRALIASFGLEPYLDLVAERLPLGVRQRLSLAVALIHEPEILILDEPTSGVDPVARDEFWDHLARLSRQERVTIFIATHFMNEALRCDRISLMHAGRVLTQGAPGEIQARTGEPTLEAAFIGLIEAAADPSAWARPAPGGPAWTGTAAPRRPGRFSLGRMLAYSRRELLEVLRDPVRLAFAFIGSAVLFVIFGFGISTDVDHVRLAILDQDRSPQSRSYAQAFTGSTVAFTPTPELTDRGSLETRMRGRDFSLAVELPPRFGRDLARGLQPEVATWIDGAIPSRAETIQSFVDGAHGTALARLAQAAPEAGPAGPGLRLAPHYRYNPNFISIYSIVPNVLAMLLMLIPAILMAVSVVREKELGSIVNFYVTPTTRLEFLLGKQLPCMAIGLLNYGLLTAMAVTVFRVPLKGSGLALALEAVLYVAATTGFGLLVSSVTRTQVAAVIGTAIISLLLTTQFSGMIQPVSTLHSGGRLLGEFWPSTYFMRSCIGAFTKGLGFSSMARDFLALALFGPAYLALGALALPKQEG